MLLKNQALKNYDGNPIKAGEKDADLKTVIINCLNFEHDKLKATAEQKIRAYLLSMDFTRDNQVELKSEDIVFIKDRMLIVYSAVIFGQVMGLLEPVSKK